MGNSANAYEFAQLAYENTTDLSKANDIFKKML
jgi:hypothetical protein